MHRLTTAAPVVAAFFLASCGSKLPCEVDSLGAGLDGAGDPTAALGVVAATCKLPEPLSAWVTGEDTVPAGLEEVWASVCPGASPPADPTRISDRLEVYAACDLQRLELTDAETFALAPGRSVLGAALQVWLTSKELDPALARRVASAVLGTPSVRPGLALSGLPRVASGEDVVAPAIRIDQAGVFVGDAQIAPLTGGKVEAPLGEGWSGWAIPGVSAAPSVAALGTASVGAFRRVAASVAGPGEAVSLIAVQGSADHTERLVGVSIRMPGKDPAVRVRARADAWEVWSAAGDALAKGATLEAARAAVPEGATVALDLPDDRTLQAFLDAAAALQRPVTLAMDRDPCGDAPSGAVCIPGGEAKVGAGRTVRISTFYLDEDEVTASDYQRCVDTGFCPAAQASGASVSGLAFEGAWRYCAWSGKRLPTEWEWEKAARGDYGLAHIGDGVAEWTTTWMKPREKACTGCEGTDPLGLCDGADRCPGVTTRAVRGTTADPSLRVAKSIYKPAAGIRCATSNDYLTRFPPRLLTSPYPDRALPAPPSDAQKKLAAAIQEDDLEAKAVCSEDQLPSWTPAGMKGGVSTNTCRDPFSYVTSNEARRHVWGKYLKNIGGGYTGVGADQAYDFIAAARSEWAWPFDYDPNVVRVHRVVQALVLHSETRQQFVDRYGDDAIDESLKLIGQVHGERGDEYKAFYSAYRSRLHKHYVRSMTPEWKDEDPTFGWLATDDNYAWIRGLYQQGRLVPVGGDLLGAGTVQSVSQTARELGVPIRVYYPSNAPLAWGGMMYPGYKANIAALPFDDESIVIASYNSGAFAQDTYWHYNVQDAQQYQSRLALEGYGHVKSLWWDRIPADDGAVTVCGLPSDP